MRNRNLYFAILLIGLFNHLEINAQLNYNQTPEYLNANKIWAFHSRAGLDFSTGIPFPIYTKLDGEGGRGSEGAASLCDPISGQLQFYTNGHTVWDRNNQPMPNGSELLGNGFRIDPTLPPEISATQGVCIVPLIGVDDKYYIFSLAPQNELRPHTPNNPLDSFALYYSIVDMSLNNGLGDVEANNKNIPLSRRGVRYSEAMIAIPGNCNDIWLLLHRSDSAVYDAYHITKEGIDTTSITSVTNGPKSPFHYFTGDMAISPDRTKLVFAQAMIFFGTALGGYGAVAEFDPSTGIVSNEIILGGLSNNIDTMFHCVSRGTAFSPDGNKLYINEFNQTNSRFELVQYDVSAHNYNSINSSRIIISDQVCRGGGLMRLYEDRIYMSDTVSINVIDSPNNSGITCNYIHQAINLLPDLNLTGSPSLGISLPTEVVFPIVRDTNFNVVLDTIICLERNWENGITLIPSEIDIENYYIWNDSSTTSKLRVFDPGVYWVAYSNSCGDYIVDTFKLDGAEMIKPQITIKVRQLGTHMHYATYQWMFNDSIIIGATQSTYDVKVNGDYRVIVTNSYNCIDTSDVYKVTNADEATILDMNLKNQISVHPNPVVDIINVIAPVDIDIRLLGIEGKILKTATNTKTISISELDSGYYLLQIFDMSGLLLKVEKIIKVSQ